MTWAGGGGWITTTVVVHMVEVRVERGGDEGDGLSSKRGFEQVFSIFYLFFLFSIFLFFLEKEN